jgi:hypothetical protein
MNKQFKKLVLNSSLVIASMASLNNLANGTEIIYNNSSSIHSTNTNIQIQKDVNNNVIISTKDNETYFPSKKIGLLFISIGGLMSSLSLLSISLAKKTKNVNSDKINKIEKELKEDSSVKNYPKL